MENRIELYHRHTDLTVTQISLLERMRVVFPFLADLAHGQLKVYVPAREKGRLLIIAQERPHTVYMSRQKSDIGRLQPAIEEPLVRQTLQTGMPGHGKREWTYGSLIDMYTYAIHDGAKVIGVISFEVDGDRLQIDDYPCLLATAVDILYHARKGVDDKQYQPISSSDGIMITDQFSRIIFANAAAQRIYRVLGVGSLKGGHLFDRQMTRHILRETMERDRPWQKELVAGNMTIIRRQIDLQEGGQLIRRIVVLSDITEIRAKDKEIRIKSAVIQEIHHRVKNNLQTIASLLRLQARRSQSEEVKNALQESVNRVLSISVVHEFLSQQGEEDINVQQVMQQIFQLVGRNMADSEFFVRTEFSGPDVVLPSKYASSLALVLNELVLNAMEHAFEGRSSGTIGLRVEEDGDHWQLDLYDDGCGLPENFDPHKTRSLGLSIVRTLIEGDLDGMFDLENDARGPGHGTHARIRLPKPDPDEHHGVVQSLEE
ncbi:sensor histidine kinase [Selenomonas montiformis]|uniref:sensor histidine kinase n=1 Tax=Selenomonas montiformis TaxID=2652285 RepID=UPI0039F5D462